jgi:hypothetical protein
MANLALTLQKCVIGFSQQVGTTANIPSLIGNKRAIATVIAWTNKHS